MLGSSCIQTLNCFHSSIFRKKIIASQNKEVYSAKNLRFCHVRTQMVLLPCHFFLLEAFRLESREIPTILVFFFSCALTRRITFSLLCSQVNWSGNLKSLPIKDSAHVRVFRKYLQNINLTFTRLLAQASPEVVPNAQCPKVSSAC